MQSLLCTKNTFKRPPVCSWPPFFGSFPRRPPRRKDDSVPNGEAGAGTADEEHTADDGEGKPPRRRRPRYRRPRKPVAAGEEKQNESEQVRGASDGLTFDPTRSLRPLGWGCNLSVRCAAVSTVFWHYGLFGWSGQERCWPEFSLNQGSLKSGKNYFLSFSIEKESIPAVDLWHTFS